jgi:hypothetical protein
VNDAGTFRPLWESFLSHWMDDGRDAVLDDIAKRANGIRSFAGDLGWAGQTPAKARAALPGLLQAALDRGLYVYVCPCTGGGYDVAAHLREVGAICAEFPNTIIDAFNEVGHPSQSDIGKDPRRALEVCRRAIPAGVPWTVGAPVGTDEPAPEGSYPTDGGLFNDAHLDRGRDFWNQVRRVRELEMVSAVTGKPCISGEPIGAAEQSQTGRRESNPTFFWTLGLLCRGFEIGSVFHSEDGLNGKLLGPNQRLCAEEHVAGFRAIPTDERLRFVNAGWSGSPVTAADFDHGITRAYSFVTASRGWTALVGKVGDPRVAWGGGWRPVGIVAERPGCQLVEIAR